MKKLLACASITATMMTAGHSAAICADAPRTFVRAPFKTTSNASRPQRLAGEVIPHWAHSTSAGWLDYGDLVVPSVASIQENLPLLAKVFSVMQSPMDRDIQQIVASNFEAYWD